MAKIVLPKDNPRANPRKPYTVRYADEHGRQREKSFARLKGPGGAEEFKKQVEYESMTGTFVDPRNASIPFTDYAAQWIERLARAPGTKDCYRSVLHTWVVPLVGSRTLAQVARDRDMVTGLLATMRKQEVSASRIGQVKSLFSGVMKEALLSGKLNNHRLGDIEIQRDAQNKPATIIPATTEQLDRLAAGLRPELALSVWLMRGVGLRIGECLAVRLDDFRENGKVLRVHQQVNRQGELAPLKHRKPGEFRDVPVPSWLWAKILAHVDAHGAPEGFLFARSDGRRAVYGGYHSRFVENAANAIAVGFTEHDLRHLYVSTLLTNSIPITEVSKWIGHRDINVTHQIYSHLVPESWDRAREVLESIVV